MISAVQLDHVKAGLAVVVLLVCLNLVQGSTIVVVMAAMVGYLFLPVLQPTKEFFTSEKQSAKDAFATGRTVKAKRRTTPQSRGLAKEQTSDEDDDDSSEDDDVAPSPTSKMKMKKLQRKTMQHKPLAKKALARKGLPLQQIPGASAFPTAADGAVDVMQLAELVVQQPAAQQSVAQQSIAHQPGVHQLFAQHSMPTGSNAYGEAVAAKVTSNLDDAMRGVSQYMELEKRSRAVEQQNLAIGGSMQRSPQSQAAKMQVEQAMVQILKCVNSIQRLQQGAPGSAQQFEVPQANPLLDYATQSLAGNQTKSPVLPLIPSAPPGLELKRSTLSASARPFEPIFASRSCRQVGAAMQ